MKNILSYRGYKAKIEFDADDSLFFGAVLGIPESITFHGETVTQLIEDFQAAVDHYLQDCELLGRKPHKPYSGKLMLRIPPEVHAHVAMMATSQGKSINQWASEVLAR